MFRPDAQVENVETDRRPGGAACYMPLRAQWRSLKHVIPCTSASTNWKAGSGNSTVSEEKAANTSKAMKHDPQNKILAYLKAGGRLTVRKAERLYHTTELRRIISRLRKNRPLRKTDGRHSLTSTICHR